MKIKLKQYRFQLITTSVVTLLPILVGLILWNKLPDVMATHFGADNQANGWSSKAMAVFGLPLILLAVQWMTVLIINFDPKRRNISDKMFSLTLWIIPAISLICCGSIYVSSLQINLNINLLVNIFTGIVFIAVGNYLPKCKRNYTVGIKLPWTLDDDENWNKTHRFGGIVWVLGGMVMLILAFLPVSWMIPDLVVLAAVVVLPTAYSFLYYLRHRDNAE